MIGADFLALSPLLVLSAAPVVVLLAIAWRRDHKVVRVLAMGSLVLALITCWFAAGQAPRQITALVLVDHFGLLYIVMTLLTTFVLFSMSKTYFSLRESQPEEYYVLLLLATAGGSVMAVSTHFASFYLGLELLSVSLYGLIAYVRSDIRGTEASIKYLILAAASAAFLLFGMALVYAELGTMNMTALAHATMDQTQNRVVLLGVAMMFVSIGFKLSIVPFHLWTADVYEGSPAPVTAFAATVSKISILAVLVRYFSVDSAPVTESLVSFIALTAAASMIAGNVLALVQSNLKRMLAFSSIAHMGYLSIAFISGGAATHETVALYLLAYTTATLGAFGVIMCLTSHSATGKEVERIGDFRGLFWSDPLAASVLAVSLLSLAGIPLTAGFLGKFYLLAAGASTNFWWLLVVLALSSTVGAYYYLRVIVLMASREDSGEAVCVKRRLPVSAPRDVVLIGLTLATLLVGMYPAPIIHFIQSMSAAH
jgi:NADH-quinone oxidoreductase subunit N